MPDLNLNRRQFLKAGVGAAGGLMPPIWQVLNQVLAEDPATTLDTVEHLH